MTDEQVLHTGIRRRRRRVILVALIVGVLVGAAATYVAYLRLTATDIGRINADPLAFAGRQVSLYGTVFEHSGDGFFISDGTGSIHVSWPVVIRPPLGTRVVVSAVVTVWILGIGSETRVSVGVSGTFVVPWAF